MHMEIKEENCCNGIERKKPVDLDREQLLPTASGNDNRPPKLLVRSKRKSKDGANGGHAQENQTEDNEIIESIVRITKNLQAVGDKLPDKGEKLKENLRRYEDEYERRKKLHHIKRLTTEYSRISKENKDRISKEKKEHHRESMLKIAKANSQMIEQLHAKQLRKLESEERLNTEQLRLLLKEEQDKDFDRFVTPHDHLTGTALKMVLEKKRQIAQRWGWDMP